MGDHRLPCTEDEIHNEAKCQEGRCQAVDLGGFRYVSCHCDIGFTGGHCELRYIDPSILESTQMKVRTAQIAGGVSVAILILFVLILAIYVLIRKRRKDRARTVNLEEPDREEARHLNERGFTANPGGDVLEQTHGMNNNTSDMEMTELSKHQNGQ